MKPANLAPVWVGLYPELAEMCRSHGYALAIHGSVGRDFDLVAVPWAPEPSQPQVLVDAITSKWALTDPYGHTDKGHGRLCWTLIVTHGDCFLDFSVMQPIGAPE